MTVMEFPTRPPASWASTRELMAHLHITSATTVTRLVREEGLPVHRLPGSRTMLFNLAEVDAWLLERERIRCDSPLPAQDVA
jgi:excisionase family DNA binding protein